MAVGYVVSAGSECNSPVVFHKSYSSMSSKVVFYQFFFFKMTAPAALLTVEKITVGYGRSVQSTKTTRKDYERKGRKENEEAPWPQGDLTIK